jgi:hypothetical protein
MDENFGHQAALARGSLTWSLAFCGRASETPVSGDWPHAMIPCRFDCKTRRLHGSTSKHWRNWKRHYSDPSWPKYLTLSLPIVSGTTKRGIFDLGSQGRDAELAVKIEAEILSRITAYVLRHRQAIIIENANSYAFLFEDIVARIFLLHLENTGRNPVLARERVPSLMDSCKPHIFDWLQNVLGENGVMPGTYAPHTVDTFQMLDFGLFGVCKILNNHTDDIESRVDGTYHIAKIIHATQETCAVPRIQTALKRGEFGVNAPGDRAQIESSEVRLRNSEGFDEIWRIDYLLENLNRRGKITSYALIKERFAEVFCFMFCSPKK